MPAVLPTEVRSAAAVRPGEWIVGNRLPAGPVPGNGDGEGWMVGNRLATSGSGEGRISGNRPPTKPAAPEPAEPGHGGTPSGGRFASGNWPGARPPPRLAEWLGPGE